MSMRRAILRPHQTKLRDQLRQLLAGGQRRIVAQPVTRFGKSILGANIAREAIDDGKRTIFVVPALSLIDQTVEKSFGNGVRDIGVIQADHPLTSYSRSVHIASARDFPPWSWNNDQTATPSAATLRWVKSRVIACANAARCAS